MDELYDWLSATLLRLLMLPGVLPLLAVMVLVFGWPRAKRVHRPTRYRIGLFVVAISLICFSLVPTYAAYVHARRPDEEWFWQALGLVMPFLVLARGLSAMASADKRPRSRARTLWPR